MQIGVDSQRAVENKRVFVIDNDEVSSMALQFMLADDNETHVLSGVAAAIDKGRDWPPNLILLGAGIINVEGAAGAVGRGTRVAGSTSAGGEKRPRPAVDSAAPGSHLAAQGTAPPFAGAGVIAQIKSQLAGVKILVVCDAADEPAAREALAQGADGMLTRPLKLETVRRDVDAQLGRRTY